MSNPLQGRPEGAAGHAAPAKPEDLTPEALTPENLTPEALADALNMLLAELFLVYFKTRNFHWHLSGPSLWDYNLLLERQSTDIIACMDAVAERLQSLGLPALHPLEAVAQRRARRGKAMEGHPPAALLRELLADKHKLIKRLQTALALATQLQDKPTSALLRRWMRTTEQHIWTLMKTL